MRTVAVVLLSGALGCSSTSTQSGSSGGSSGGGSSGSVDTSSVTPLPETAFVFIHRERPHVDHIYSFDTATGQATLITKLKDDGTNGTEIAGRIALSHDRKQIAFAAIYEVVPLRESLASGGAQAIWAVTVDGKSFARFTSPLGDASQQSCQVDSDCSVGTCRSGKCSSPGYGEQINIQEPAWSTDDKTVWFSFGTFSNATGSLSGGSVLGYVPTTGALPKLVGPLLPNCSITSSPAVSPDGTKIAAYSGVCTQGQDSVVVTDVPPSKTLAQFQGPGLAPDLDLVWSPEGSALYAIYAVSQQPGVVMQPVNGGDPTAIVAPQANDPFVNGLALSPDGKTMVVSLTTNATNGGCDLVSITGFTGGAQPKATQLTNDGKSCRPAWR